MNNTRGTIVLLALLLPLIASAQSPSSILPIVIGAYAPAEGGCDAAAAAFIYIEDKSIGANKTIGKVESVKREGKFYVLDILWVEVGASDADGDRDTVRIDVQNDRSFYFSNSASDRTLMQWCK